MAHTHTQRLEKTRKPLKHSNNNNTVCVTHIVKEETENTTISSDTAK